MRLLLVHPSSLMYSEIFLRLEPIGVERVAGAAREAGHEVRVMDLQVFSHADLAAELASFRPQALGVSLNLLRNLEVFERWTRLGLSYMFLGMEAIDAEGLDLYRKRVSRDDNFRALEAARRLGINVAINLIVDPAWDAERFRTVREFALSVPEIVHLTVMTPYPGTEIWHTESRRLTTRDYRLFDIQHAVVPTTLPLQEFYRELVRTQSVINRKHLGVRTAAGALGILGANLARGQTNFARMLWKFNKVYNPERQFADHQRPVRYELPLPCPQSGDRRQLYIHARPEPPREKTGSPRGAAGPGSPHADGSAPG